MTSVVTRVLTKIGDHYGLVRDNHRPDQTDGLTHLYVGAFVHLLVSGVCYFFFWSYLFSANVLAFIVITTVLCLMEFSQEKKMCEEDPSRVFHWSLSRLQDVFLYYMFGLFLCICLGIWWF